MKRITLAATAIFGTALLACIALAQAPATGPNTVVKTSRTGGDGGFDYIYADVDARKLYIPRSGQGARVQFSTSIRWPEWAKSPASTRTAWPPTRNPDMALPAASLY